MSKIAWTLSYMWDEHFVALMLISSAIAGLFTFLILMLAIGGT